MFITGRLVEYPLSTLIEIFLHKRETGLLEISSPTESGSFYFKDGQLIDAALGSFRGAEAVKLGATLANASFQFKSIAPDEYLRRVWDSSFESPGTGLNDTLRTQAVVFHSALGQFSAYALAIYQILKKVLRLVVRRTLPVIKVMGRVTLKALIEIKKQIALKGPILWDKGRALIQVKNTARMAPPVLQRLPGSRMSLAIIAVTLLIATLITQLERSLSNHDQVAPETPAMMVPNELQAQSTRRRPRAKRRSTSRGKRRSSVRQKSLTVGQTEASVIK